MLQLVLMSLVSLLTACSTLTLPSQKFTKGIEFANSRNWAEASLAFKQVCEDGKAGACSIIGQKTVGTQNFPILQGLSPFSTASFRILTLKGENYYYFIYPKHLTSTDQVLTQGRWLTPTSITEKKASKWTSVALKANGLENGLAYILEIYSEKGELLDQRTFQTLNLGKPNLNFIAASCMDDSYEVEQTKMWRDVYEQQPDVIFMLGDNVYGDQESGPSKEVKDVSPDKLWERYAETRSKLQIFKIDRLIPVVALWDDHDIGQDNGDKTFIHIQEAKTVFEAFFAQDEIPQVFIKGPGVSSYFQAAGQNFFFMDGRSYRSPDNKGGEDETHWGNEAEEWMFTLINNNKAPTWVVSGDQIFGGYHSFESFEGNHPNHFAKIKDRWRTLSVPLVFLSGDRHLTEINKIDKSHLGYSTYELTSSGIHSRVYPDSYERNPNPNKIEGVAGQMSYMAIQSSAFRGTLRFSVKAFGIDKNVFYKKDLSVKR